MSWWNKVYHKYGQFLRLSQKTQCAQLSLKNNITGFSHSGHSEICAKVFENVGARVLTDAQTDKNGGSLLRIKSKKINKSLEIWSWKLFSNNTKCSFMFDAAVSWLLVVTRFNGGQKYLRSRKFPAISDGDVGRFHPADDQRIDAWNTICVARSWRQVSTRKPSIRVGVGVLAEIRQSSNTSRFCSAVRQARCSLWTRSVNRTNWSRTAQIDPPTALVMLVHNHSNPCI